MNKHLLDNALAVSNNLKAKLHRLRNTWPCGIRSVDDRTDADIKNITQDIAEWNQLIRQLRKEIKEGAR